MYLLMDGRHHISELHPDVDRNAITDGYIIFVFKTLLLKPYR